MPGDRYNPQDIAAAGGADLGAVVAPGDLDELAADEAIPDGPNVVGQGPDVVTPIARTPGVAPPIGSVVGEKGNGDPVEGSPAYKDSVFAQSILDKVKEGDLEGSLLLIPNITNPLVADILMPELGKSVTKYVENILGAGGDDDVVHTLAFERARQKAEVVSNQDLAQKVNDVIDEAESAAILASSETFPMKIILTTRLHSREKRKITFADICLKELRNSAGGYQAVNAEAVYDLLKSLNVSQDWVAAVKNYASNTNNSRETVLERIVAALSSNQVKL